MAVTVTDPIEYPLPVGDRFITVRQVDFDSSYPAGGEAVTLAQLGFSRAPDWVEIVPKSGFEFEWDAANKKIKVLAPIKKYTAALNPASMATDAVSSLAVTVTGVAATDICLAVQPAAALEAGIVIQSARVSAANTITVELSNTSAGTVDAASANADFYVIAANGAMQEVPAATDLSALTDVVVKAYGQFLA